MVCGDALNPLQVNLMISNVNASAPNSRTPAEQEPPNLSDLVGATYQANENLILEKMRKVCFLLFEKDIAFGSNGIGLNKPKV